MRCHFCPTEADFVAEGFSWCEKHWKEWNHGNGKSKSDLIYESEHLFLQKEALDQLGVE